MFPVSNKSQDVVDVLINQLKENHVELRKKHQLSVFPMTIILKLKHK